MITVQIGNSDDKLTQKEWSEFVHNAEQLISICAIEVYFFGFSSPGAPWQNAAWCFELPVEDEPIMQRRLTGLAKDFRQDSIAWTSGQSVLLRTKK